MGRRSWYPYPFLNPAQTGGYGGVFPWVLVIFVVIEALLAGIIAVGRRRSRLIAPALAEPDR